MLHYLANYPKIESIGSIGFIILANNPKMESIDSTGSIISGILEVQVDFRYRLVSVWSSVFHFNPSRCNSTQLPPSFCLHFGLARL